MHITINKTKLFFDVYGSKLNISNNDVTEKPTLIVLHGGHGFADHTLYVEFWSQLSDLAQIIFLDQRGCGRSELGSSQEWNLQQWSEDLYQFCQTLGILKPIIAGVSMGGHVMCEFISRHADFPRGLIFCNTEAKFSLDLVCKHLNRFGDYQAANSCREFYVNPTEASFKEYIHYCIPYYAKNAYSTTELNRCIKHPEVFLHYCKQQMLQFDYLNDMKKIHCPTLLLGGRDSLHAVEALNEMAGRIDKEYLTVKVFADCGAPVYKDKPEESYQTVKKFLQNF